MKMLDLAKSALFVLLFAFILSSCKKEPNPTSNSQTLQSGNMPGTVLNVGMQLKLEAESAVLTNGAVVQGDSARSGGAVVSQNGGDLTFQVNIPTEGNYSLSINASSPYGEKINIVEIDGVASNFTLTDANYLTKQLASNFKLSAGSHTISIKRSWGYIFVDYITLDTLVPAPPSLEYEAEAATLSSGAVIQKDSTRSGDAYVAQNAGNIAFTVNLATEGFYNVYINASSPYGPKTNTVEIDGSTADFTLNNADYASVKIVSTIKLSAGLHTISIKKSWGYINVDYLKLAMVDPSSRYNINNTFVTPNATAEAHNLYQFLRNNYGKKIISGVMTLNSFDETDWLKQHTGKEPAIVGLDFMHSGRGYTWYENETPVRDARAWWNKNGIPVFVWHWRDPSRLTEEFYTNKTNFDVSKINDPASTEYMAMLKDIDYVSHWLKQLQSQNIPVIWRPLHEAAGGWFWWGAKGAQPCKKLYQVMYDRMVNYHKLKNLIWVWTNEPKAATPDADWYPGDNYVDIVGVDIYKTGDHNSQSILFNNLNDLYGGKKIVTVSECGSIPDVDNLVKDAAAWSWFMPWYGDFTRNSTNNSLDLWKKMFASEYVITLDEMPSLKSPKKE
jgi:mannan endo-1,4-beta-mannosidase